MFRMVRFSRVAIVVMLAVFAFVTPAAAADKDCVDFGSQEEAQAYFNAGGGSPSYNYNNLDADHDGYACETFFGYIADPVVSQPDTGGSIDEDTSDDAGENTSAGDVTGLPETGTGVTADASIVPMTLVVTALMCAGVAVQMRNRAAR